MGKKSQIESYTAKIAEIPMEINVEMAEYDKKT